MQAGVNPLAVVNPHITPLAIIYEPPGNCSYAKLTQTDVVGSTLSALQSSSTATNTLVDPGAINAALGDQQPQNFTSQQTSTTSRIDRLTLSQSQTFGTALSAGLPNNCLQPGASVPARANSGPGNGDLFLLLMNQPIIYWDQAGLSNFLFGPSQGSQLLAVPAWELKTPEGLQQLQTQNNITITQDEAQAILKLDPLVTSPSRTVLQGLGPFFYPQLPKRFIPINQPSISLPAGIPANFSVTRDEVVSADSQSCSLTSSVSNTDSVGLTDKLEVLGAETLLSFEVGEILGGGKVADAIGGGIKGISPGQLFGETKTSVTVGLNSCKGLGNSTDNSVTQDAFLKDTNNGINVAPYYDAFFGTTAYVPLPIGMGVLTQLEASDLKLPNFVWNVQARLNSDLRLALPPELASKLSALGHVSMKLAPAASYIVTRNTSKGLAAGLQLDPRGNVTGKLGTPQNTQALFFVEDALGKPVALLWLNIATTF